MSPLSIIYLQVILVSTNGVVFLNYNLSTLVFQKRVLLQTLNTTWNCFRFGERQGKFNKSSLFIKKWNIFQLESIRHVSAWGQWRWALWWDLRVVHRSSSGNGRRRGQSLLQVILLGEGENSYLWEALAFVLSIYSSFTKSILHVL